MRSKIMYRLRVLGTTALVASVMVAGYSSCSKKSKKSPAASDRPGIVVPSGNIPSPTTGTGDIPFLGGFIQSQVIAGQVFIPIEGTFSDLSFAAIESANSAQQLRQHERAFVLREELTRDLGVIQKSMKVLQIKVVPEVGFFSAMIPLDSYARLAEVKGLDHRILINPVVSMPTGDEVRGLKSAQSTSLGLRVQSSVDGRIDHASFSGLERIGTLEFLDKVKSDLNEEIDGSTVKVGVTDTGVTYNHPSFLNAQGSNRIKYMKDFTNEGQIYFASNAKFEAREPSESELPSGLEMSQAIVLTAEVVPAVVGTRIPTVEKLQKIENKVFAVTPALKAALLTPDSGARLGFLAEESFAKKDDGEFVDLNHNGKNNDFLPVLLLPNAEVAKSKIFVDMSGRGDFRKSAELGDFNETKTTQKIFAETAGFHLKTVELVGADGESVPAVGAAIVGFDPGNHGSHVSGIIAGRKTILNDSEHTLARGVAPNAELMVNRVCANNGGCNATSAIIDLSMSGAEIINMSLGGLSPLNDGYGVQETVINRLTAVRNTLFVISAGNSGPGRQTVGSPSVARFALSVAATGSRKLIERQYQWPGSGKPRSGGTEDEDFVMYFSSRGPTAAGGFKPDISAPGTQLSAIQLNSANGSRAGLDIYWGTSMAAPTATGATALLLDAAKKYNAKFPDRALPIDALTLRKVISESAIPFDMNMYDVKSGKRSFGQYTWIDQGNGMINLARAWDSLKQARDTSASSAVAYMEDGKKVEVPLDYQIRVLRKSPNGLDYSGVEMGATDAQGGKEPKFGRGIYLDVNESDSLIPVQVARRLPASVLKRSDLGDLERLLNTTSDTFELETVIYGSPVEWLKAGVLSQLACVNNSVSPLTIIGSGDVDDFANGESLPIRASVLNVCVDRALVATLPAGDHGALIKAYRSVDGHREAMPSFVVPVYLAVPHATVAARAGYQIEKRVASFEVQRHYVQIPHGTSAVKITLEVPEAKVNGNIVSDCSGVRFSVHESGNTELAPELEGSKGRAINCNSVGATSNQRVISYERLNPKAGIWDLLVIGNFAFKDSAYKINVEFAKVETSTTSIEGTIEALTGTIQAGILDGSSALQIDGQSSVFELSGLSQVSSPLIEKEQELSVPSKSGVIARAFDESVASVIFSTGGSKGNDLDLSVLECADAEMSQCVEAGSSGGATDEEIVKVMVTKGKFYVPVVIGYDVVNGPAKFDFTEVVSFKERDHGSVKVSALEDSKFKVDYALDPENSKLLRSEMFRSGQWDAIGNLILRTSEHMSLIDLPVIIHPTVN